MNFRNNKFLTLTLLLGLSFVLAGCASSRAPSSLDERSDVSDPFEGTNRVIFAFNNKVDDYVISPTVKGYRYIFPKEARKGLGNFLSNLKSPAVFANQLLQGDLDGAGTVLFRTTVNTFAGFGGILDVAAAEGIEHEQEDFGQTLAVWGVGHGPYLVVPIIGPSSARDTVGFIADGFVDPLKYYLFNVDEDGLYYARIGSEYLTVRDRLLNVLEDLEASSIDYYAATRSIYYQRREALVNDERPGSADIPDFD